MNTLDDISHEIWAAAQLLPGEGIVDGVDRITAILQKEFCSETDIEDISNGIPTKRSDTV